jgi:hypothetical protein
VAAVNIQSSAEATAAAGPGGRGGAQARRRPPLFAARACAKTGWGSRSGAGKAHTWISRKPCRKVCFDSTPSPSQKQMKSSQIKI